tara:strand:+ start:50 stop:157 length:108 start_codon:yes stop_codon:yes gene_type:complete
VVVLEAVVLWEVGVVQVLFIIEQLLALRQVLMELP